MKGLAYLLVAGALLQACSHKTIPQAAAPGSTTNMSVLPASEIDVPVQVNLRPVFSAIEQTLQLEYSSPGWPDEFETEGCDTKYMYSFRTGDLKIGSRNNFIGLNFTGFYQLKGSQRICVSGNGVSPWSPACGCGMGKETERRVNIGLGISLGIRSDYRLDTKLGLLEPSALDKCNICFFKKDITGLVMGKIKEQMENMRNLFQGQLDSVNLRPQLEKMWNKFTLPQYVSSMGYINARPSAIRLSPFNITGDTLLNVLAGITMQPEASLHPNPTPPANLPALQQNNRKDGFALYTDVKLQYDSMTRIVNRYAKGFEYYFKKGIIKKHFVVDSCQFYGAANNILVVRVFFSGTDRGTAYLFGQPVLDNQTNTITLANPQYDIRTKDLAINLGNSLFKKRIKKELLKYTSYNFGNYLDTAKTLVTRMMNRELSPGINMTGVVKEIKPLELSVQPGYLLIRVTASGAAAIKVNSFTVPSAGLSQ